MKSCVVTESIHFRHAVKQKVSLCFQTLWAWSLYSSDNEQEENKEGERAGDKITELQRIRKMEITCSPLLAVLINMENKRVHYFLSFVCYQRDKIFECECEFLFLFQN